MLTVANSDVNAAPRAVMMSIAAIAQRDGVSKPAVSRKVKQLVEKHGLAVERDGQGRVAAVNVAQYDELRGRYGDPSKAQAPAPTAAAPPPPPPDGKPSETYDEALRQRTWIEAERSRIRLAQEKGELIEVAALATALGECGGEIARIVDRLISHCDEMAATVGKDGVHGLRVLTKKIAFELKTDIASALEAAAGASERDQASESIEAAA